VEDGAAYDARSDFISLLRITVDVGIEHLIRELDPEERNKSECWRYFQKLRRDGLDDALDAARC
jgi:hypothetical protein